VGSPNAILRREVDGRVIVRTGRRIPGVTPMAGVHAPISVIRMAVDDAYGAKEWRERRDGDEWAFRTEKISRRTCAIVADYAFRHARRLEAIVFGGPKYTVSPVYEGMLKEEMDRASSRYRDVRYQPHLIDATYALLLNSHGEPLVIPALNRDGDNLSDLVMQLFGSIAGAESMLLAFDEKGAVKAAMAEAPHGTAPLLQGKNVANPMAMILALAGLFAQMRGDGWTRASRAIYEGTLEAVAEGERTADLAGHATTTEFTDEVIRRVRTKVEVWSALADVRV
jgi:isocitrate/isopropylmalate dehydrogenase